MMKGEETGDMIANPSNLYYIYGKYEDGIYETLNCVYDEVQPPSLRLPKRSPLHDAAPTRPRWYRFCGIPVGVILMLFFFLFLWLAYFSITERHHSADVTTMHVGPTTTVPTKPPPIGDKCDPYQKLEYMTRPWYVDTHTDDPDYYCDEYHLVTNITVEKLPLGCCTSCKDYKSCQQFQAQYKQNYGTEVKYSFYISNNGTVYSGRNWTCPLVSGSLWVGVMVDCKPHTPPCDSILRYFMEITVYGKKCGLIALDATVYVDDTDST